MSQFRPCRKCTEFYTISEGFVTCIHISVTFTLFFFIIVSFETLLHARTDHLLFGGFSSERLLFFQLQKHNPGPHELQRISNYHKNVNSSKLILDMYPI